MKKTTIALAFLGGMFRRVANRMGQKLWRRRACRACEGAEGRQDHATAGADGQRQSRQADLREVRGRARQAAALGLHDEGGPRSPRWLLIYKPEVAKAEPITGGEDLTGRRAERGDGQSERSLDAAASEAVKENKGYRAVSVNARAEGWSSRGRRHAGEGHRVETAVPRRLDWQR